MANTKISQMTSATSVGSGDILPIVQSGSNFSCTTNQLIVGNNCVVSSTSTSLTNNRLLVGQGNSTITPLSLGSSNQLLGMNNGGTANEYKTLNSGTNITVTNGTGSITIGLTGILSIANGGTNSSTTLTNNKIIHSSSGKLVELSNGTANQILGMDTAGVSQEYKTLTAGSNITLTNGVGSVTIASSGGGGGGSMSIGAPVAASVINQVLYVDASNNLASAEELGFDGTTLTAKNLTVSPAGNMSGPNLSINGGGVPSGSDSAMLLGIDQGSGGPRGNINFCGVGAAQGQFRLTTSFGDGSNIQDCITVDNSKNMAGPNVLTINTLTANTGIAMFGGSVGQFTFIPTVDITTVVAAFNQLVTELINRGDMAAS